MNEIWCPYCNGSGKLPRARVDEIEAARDEYAVRKELTMRLWGELSGLVTYAGRKKVTFEGLQSAIRASHRAMGKFMNLDRIGGR